MNKKQGKWEFQNLQSKALQSTYVRTDCTCKLGNELGRFSRDLLVLHLM